MGNREPTINAPDIVIPFSAGLGGDSANPIPQPSLFATTVFGIARNLRNNFFLKALPLNPFAAKKYREFPAFPLPANISFRIFRA